MPTGYAHKWPNRPGNHHGLFSVTIADANIVTKPLADHSFAPSIYETIFLSKYKQSIPRAFSHGIEFCSFGRPYDDAFDNIFQTKLDSQCSCQQ